MQFSDSIEEAIEVTVNELSDEWENYSEADNDTAVFEEADFIVGEHSTEELFSIVAEAGRLDAKARFDTIRLCVHETAFDIIRIEITERIEGQ